jgi:hypothetical protein
VRRRKERKRQLARRSLLVSARVVEVVVAVSSILKFIVSLAHSECCVKNGGRHSGGISGTVGEQSCLLAHAKPGSNRAPNTGNCSKLYAPLKTWQATHLLQSGRVVNGRL